MTGFECVESDGVREWLVELEEAEAEPIPLLVLPAEMLKEKGAG